MLVRKILCSFMTWMAIQFGMAHAQTASPDAATPKELSGRAITLVKLQSGEDNLDKRFKYMERVVRLALTKTAEQGPFEIQIASPLYSFVTPERSWALLKEGGKVDVYMAVATKELDQNFLPAKVGIKFGSIGQRVFLTHKKNKESLKNVDSLAGLKPHAIGSGHSWTDTKIMREAGLTVITGTAYRRLFDMLRAGRFQLLTRAIYEVFDEMRTFGKGDLEVEPSFLLSYPTEVFLYFSRKKPRLAARIEQGLQRASQDGSLFDLYWSVYGSNLKALNLSQRKVVSISNPFLPEWKPIGYKDWESYVAQGRELILEKAGSR